MTHPPKHPDPATADTPPRVQQAFIARGLRARDEAKRSGDYTSAAAVLAELGHVLRAAAAAPNASPRRR